MSIQQITQRIIFIPILVGLLICFAPLFLVKLPVIICERFRAVRRLALVGSVYYAFLLALLAVLLEPPWWAYLAAAVWLLVEHWLLPNPLIFCFRPRVREAVFRAIEYLEALGEQPIYGRVKVLAVEPGSVAVQVSVGGFIPLRPRFLIVGDNGGAVRELDWDEAATRYNLSLRLLR